MNNDVVISFGGTIGFGGMFWITAGSDVLSDDLTEKGLINGAHPGDGFLHEAVKVQSICRKEVNGGALEVDVSLDEWVAL